MRLQGVEVALEIGGQILRSGKTERLPVDVTRAPTYNPERFVMVTLGQIAATFNTLGEGAEI